MSCATCGADVPDAARWCGRCGARTGPPPPPPAAAPDLGVPVAGHGADRAVGAGATDEPVRAQDGGSPPQVPDVDGGGAPRRARLPVAVVLVVAVVALLVDAGASTSQDLLGRVDVATGATSSVAPGALEVVRWATPLPGPDGAVAPDGRPARVVAPGHVAVRDAWVVTADDVTPTRVGAPRLPARDGLEPRLDGRDLLLLDAATGRVARRVTLVPRLEDAIVELLGWAGDGVVLFEHRSGATGALGTDGRLRWLRDLGAAPPPVGTDAGRWLVLRLLDGSGLHVALDAVTGRVGARFAPTVEVVDAPRVVEPDDGPAVAVAVGADSVLAWDPASGRVVWERDVLGQPALAVGEDRSELVVWGALAAGDGTTSLQRVDPVDGRVTGITRGPTVRRRSAGLPLWDADGRGAVTAVDGQVVVVAWSGDGQERVALDVDGVTAVALLGDVVAVGSRAPDGSEVVRLHARGDGAVLGAVASGADRVGLAAAVGGAVGVATGGAPVPGVGRLAWVRLADGALLDGGRLLDATLGEEPVRGVRLLAVLPDGRPLLSRDGAGERLELLDAGRVQRVTVPQSTDLATTVPRAVGTVDGQLVLGVRGDTGARALLVDPAGGPATLLAAGRPVATVGDRVLLLGGQDRLRVVGAVASGPGVAVAPSGPAGPPVGAPVDGVGDAAAFADTAVVAGPLVVGRSASGSGLVAVDAAAGTVAWRRALPTEVADGPLAVGDHLVHVGADGVLRAHDAATGRPAWRRRPADGSLVTSLAVADEVVVVGTSRGRAVVLDVRGAVLAAVAFAEEPLQQVAVLDGLVVGVVGRTLLAAGPDDGTLPADDAVVVR